MMIFGAIKKYNASPDDISVNQKEQKRNKLSRINSTKANIREDFVIFTTTENFFFFYFLHSFPQFLEQLFHNVK